ncbi:cytoplasmic dynein 2 intermediate chain 1 isoform X2 [Hyperolius riggenbachi]|uniref:cytoplasmic dynein 2 intermediate chain 1 isoform X2 n=1 Tax=Hyperolius riggenbachi TaxID=752182 RepID=UPI0035A399CE
MQPERHKTKEDTWKSEELKKHLKPMQSESSNEQRHKERRHHREEDQDENVERRHKSDRKERDGRDYESTRHAEREKREREGYAETDRRADKERGERRNNSESDRHAGKERREKRDQTESDRHAEKERREKRGQTESDRHAEKEKRDGYPKSDRHAERERRERRGHAESDRHAEKESREKHGHTESDRHAEKERGEKRDHAESDRYAKKEREEKRGFTESGRHAEKERGERRGHTESDRHAEKERRERRGYPEDDRHAEKEGRERRGYPEVDRHAEKERRERRGYPDGDRHAEKERREKQRYPESDRHPDKEGGQKRSHHESDRHADRERDRVRDHHREKEKPRDMHRTGEKEKDNTTKDYGTTDLSREERKIRESVEKTTHRSDDRERRHQEKREKERRKQKTDEFEDGNIRHLKRREDEIEETVQSTDNAYEDSINYEEDFEDYDDDFEDASEEEKTPEPAQDPPPAQRNKEIEEIQTAMLLENENVSPVTQRHKSQGHYSQEPEPNEADRSSRKSHRGVFIDFGSAKQRQVSSQIASKQKKRSLEILKLIDLDFSSTFSLLDLAPVKEYEMYIRNFGRTNTKQAYVQCNDDAIDREIQTEEIDIEEKWTQHPAESAVVCGGQKNDSENVGLSTRVDAQRLTDFLHSASQVMAVLLEENRAEYQSQSKVQSKEPCMSISEGCFHLNTKLPFLQGRQVYQLHFSDTQRHLLLTVHILNDTSGSAVLREKCLICVWNVWQPFTPQHILTCDSEVECCCFSPGNACLVFAGTVNGSVLVWDLREDVSTHHTIHIEDDKWTFRSVTFSTDGVYIPVNHKHPIKAIEPVPSGEAKDHGISQLSSHEEISGLSFQLASLDESGHLIFWVVVELRKADLAGSQSDLGLIPCGKVKLIHSSSVDLHEKFFHKDILTLGTPETLNIKFLPQDSNHFIIGTDLGIVSHGTRYGVVEPPIQYTSLNSKLRPSKVTATDFSPFGVPAFLAGCSDGSIRLHSISAEYPVMQWNDTTSGQAITALQWSLTRPTMFFVLDAASSIYVWDLLQNDLQPVAQESITSDLVLSMAVFGEPEKNNHLMGLALAKASGKVEIQYIKKKWSKTQPNELEKLQLILQEVL